MSESERLVRVLFASLFPSGLMPANELLESAEPGELLAMIREGRLPARLQAVANNRLAGRDPFGLGKAVLDATNALGARVLIPGDDEWHDRVGDLAMSAESGGDDGVPFCLWARGPAHLRDTLERSVAIVGSRAASPYGLGIARRFALGLAEKGWGVVSGGADGIDAAAHRGALLGEDGAATIAVLATGIDIYYPERNRRLFDEIAEQGLLVTELPPGSVPQKYRFLVRNRLIAAATLGTVVVEAALRSGARNTARRAVELDRPLMIVPSSIDSRYSTGVHQLAREPSGARIVTRPEEIIEDVGRIGEDLAEPLRAADGARDLLNPLAARVLDCVPRRGGALPDQIAAQAGLEAREVLRSLPELLMAGLVDEVGGRWRMRAD